MGDDAPRTPFPGSRTPGWNDPPNVQYNPNANASTGRVRSMLNKRVAFPLHGIAGSDTTPKPMAIVPPSQSSYVSLPTLPTQMPPTTNPIAVVHPMPQNTLPRTLVNTTTTNNLITDDNIDPLSILLPFDAKNVTINAFRDQIMQVDETQSVRREEIINRLGIIEQLWETDALAASIKQKLFNMAKAVKDKNYNEAMNFYTEIVTYHSNECAMWSMALRNIILTLLPRNNIIDSNTSVVATTTTSSITTTAGGTGSLTGIGTGTGTATGTATATGIGAGIGTGTAVRGSVPSMIVPAMPRYNVNVNDENLAVNATETNGNNSSQTQSSSAVQHI